MARTGTVVMQLQVPLSGAIQMMQQFGRAGGNVNVTVQNINKGLKQTAANARGLASGIGGFFLLHQAMTKSRELLMGNLKNAAALQSTLIRMGFVAGYTKTQMAELANEAERVGAFLPALTTEDTLELMERLGRALGSNASKVKDYSRTFAEAASNIHLFSKGKVSPDQAGRELEELIHSFGGFGGGKDLKNLIRKFQATVISFSPDDPGRLMSSMRSASPLMQAVGMSPEQILQLSAFRMLRPTSGRSSGGRDYAQLVMESIGALDKAKKSKSGADKIKIMEQLGIVRDGKPAIFGQNGEVDVVRLFASMQANTAARQKELGPEGYKRLVASLGSAGFGQMSQRLLLQGISPTIVQEFQQIIDRITRNTDGLDGATAEFRNSLKGATETLTSTMESMSTHAFVKPGTALGEVLAKINTRLEKVQEGQLTGPNSGLFNNALVSGITGLSVGTQLGTFGVLAKAIPNVLGPGLVTSFIGAVGTGLMAAGTLAAIAGAVGLAIVAGLALYEASPKFKAAADAISTILGKIITMGLEGLIPKMPEGLGKMFLNQFIKNDTGLSTSGGWDKSGGMTLESMKKILPTFSDRFGSTNMTPREERNFSPAGNPILVTPQTGEPTADAPPKAEDAYGFKPSGPKEAAHAGARSAFSRRQVWDSIGKGMSETLQNDWHYSSGRSGIGPNFAPGR